MIEEPYIRQACEEAGMPYVMLQGYPEDGYTRALVLALARRIKAEREAVPVGTAFHALGVGTTMATFSEEAVIAPLAQSCTRHRTSGMGTSKRSSALALTLPAIWSCCPMWTRWRAVGLRSANPGLEASLILLQRQPRFE